MTAVYNSTNYIATMKPLEKKVNRPITLPEKIENNPKIVNNNYIKGVILDKTNKPIVKAKVNISDKKNNLIKYLITDEFGAFGINTPLNEGEYYVDVNAEGYKFNRGLIKIKDSNAYMFKIISIN